MSGIGRRTRLTLLAASLASLLVAGAPAAMATPSASGVYRSYVAVGDSYAAGPGIPDQTGQPPGCGRSNRNYPALLAKWLRITDFTDVSCGGATTEHMTAPQPVSGGKNPPQLNALRSDTALVTVMIGGNDMGFGEVLATCGRLAATDPAGNPCERHYTAGGTDRLAARVDATGPKVGVVLDEVRQRSPRAHIVLVGYLRLLPSDRSCLPEVPFAERDAPYFDGMARRLNQVLGAQARKHRATFVNPYPFSAGHDACQAPDRKWVEGLRPTSPAATMHPNAKGMIAVAAIALPSVLLRR